MEALLGSKLKKNHLIMMIVFALVLTSSVVVSTPRVSHKDPMPGEECFSDDSDYQCVNPAVKTVRDSTLIFVTPWNKIGYELVQTYSHKVDMISPVWFYIEKNKNTGKFEFQGRQDIDKKLIEGIKQRNAKIKILPRMYVSASEDELKWFIQPENFNKVFAQLVSIAAEEGIDGYVFDFPLFNRLKYSGPVKKCLDTIEEKFSHLYKVITFSGYRISITKSIQEVEPYLRIFNKILVCTYDYPNKTFDKWLGPVGWVSDNIEFYLSVASKLNVAPNRFMLGVPFYGYMVDGNTYSSKQIQVAE